MLTTPLPIRVRPLVARPHGTILVSVRSESLNTAQRAALVAWACVATTGCAGSFFLLGPNNALAAPACAIAAAAVLSWGVLVFVIQAVSNREADFEELFDACCITAAVGGVFLAFQAAANVACVLVSSTPWRAGASLIAFHAIALIIGNAAMALTFINITTVARGTVVRLWALLNLTFVLILAVVVAGGGW